jgi:hypothetical protein
VRRTSFNALERASYQRLKEEGPSRRERPLLVCGVKVGDQKRLCPVPSWTGGILFVLVFAHPLSYLYLRENIVWVSTIPSPSVILDAEDG